MKAAKVVIIGVAIVVFACTWVESGSMTNKKLETFASKDLDGKDTKIYIGDGNVVLIDFWASWCLPCVRGMPKVDALYKRYKDKGFKVYALNVGPEPKKKVEHFLNRRKFSFTVYQSSQEIEKMFGGIQYIPRAFIIDKKGVIKHDIQRPESLEDLDKKISGLLKEEK